MKEESKTKFKMLLNEYLEKNSLLLYKEVWDSLQRINKTEGDRQSYRLESFIKHFSLPVRKENESYKLWKYIYQKDIPLAYEIVLSYIEYPTQQYAKKEYVDAIFTLYTKSKKENKILWSIVNTKPFLNNHINEVKKLFDENCLSNSQKTEIVSYYLKEMDRSIKLNKKFNTLENKRLITLLNESLTKPLEIDLIEEKKLEIKTKTTKCVYFDVTVKELMQYSLKLSDKDSEHLLFYFSKLLPQVNEAETSDVIERRQDEGKSVVSYGYAILTKLDEKLIQKIFTLFIDNYASTNDTQQSFPSEENMLDCLKFSVIKARKENLENHLVIKNNKQKITKI